ITSAMPSSILSTLILTLLQHVCLTADHCHSYWDTNGVFHDTQECEKYCCGDCRTKYCCSDIKYNFTEEKQELCFRRCALHFSLFSPSIAGSRCGQGASNRHRTFPNGNTKSHNSLHVFKSKLMSHVYKENGTKNEETSSSTVQIQINF
uniref:Shisa N-terminal domain-containing protein n=1 Tax=Pundamilia nyererei TaxID=303518 RepID=A0A3B4GDD8_9CICH